MKSFYAYLTDNRNNPEMAIKMYQSRQGYAKLHPILKESIKETRKCDFEWIDFLDECDDVISYAQRIQRRRVIERDIEICQEKWREECIAQEYVNKMIEENSQGVEWKMFLTICDNIVLTTNFRRQMKRSN